MSALEVSIGLAVVAVLTSYLYVKHQQRVRSRYERAAREWTGKGIDVSQIKPAIDKVRRDYLTVRRPVKGMYFHQALLGLARKVVARLAYFQHRKSEEHADVSRQPGSSG